MQGTLILQTASNKVTTLQTDNCNPGVSLYRKIAELKERAQLKPKEDYRVFVSLQSKMNAPGFVVEDEINF